ncbi:MAG: serine/threonine-protein kinase [Acidobacteriia bacterium]|nr:serine/threonine-protein kinase [Terriglobia bacterium]
MSPQFSIAHYRVTTKLGEGGMGEVWRATDTKLNRDVAIKILPEIFAQDADRMARFAREAQVLASLNHPNIAAMYGVEDRALIMELVEGPTLAERITAGPLPLDEVVPIALQITEALEYAHDKSIVHRDLKPANIKVTPDGRVKILDFGLAKALSSETVAADPSISPTLTMRSTLVGVIMGTAAYMSPEQARGAPADRRSDIWAFGVVLYEMLSGKRLFTGESVSDILAAVLRGEPDWSALPADTPPRIRKLLRRCLERDRKQRLQAIGEARIAIDAPEEDVRAQSPRGMPHAWMAATVLLAIALVVLFALHFRERPQSSPVVRFQIPSVEAISPVSRRTVALSPDGRQIAFVAPGPGGQIMLWVRALDSLEARLLPGTENASHPFWSPDGRHLAFFTTASLKKIDVSGGPAQTLCSVGYVHGGTWNRDGVILVSGGVGGGLARVSQAGDLATVTTPDPNHGELWHGYPQFLPDGQHFLYFAFAGTDARSGIYLGTLEGKEKKSLLNTGFSAAYVGPSAGEKTGRLLFLREGVLMARPTDPRTYEAADDAVPVAPGVASVARESLFTVSENGVLAYRSGSTISPKAPLTWFDRTGKVLSELGARGYYTNLALSPDGSRAAVGQADEPKNGSRPRALNRETVTIVQHEQ